MNLRYLAICHFFYFFFFFLKHGLGGLWDGFHDDDEMMIMRVSRDIRDDFALGGVPRRAFTLDFAHTERVKRTHDETIL
ncbi:hypothetical protein BGZ60DRAFT_148948 [Tricladium varicosporioides]|nr:hypothetical protein BGZ60DRAFT_148948 [Hymenoscyphus varicosporioides]